MDWARDWLGKDILASECKTRHGLNCPTCGEPVVRRAGEYRLPYFAHKNHCAKPECENYHPTLHPPTLTVSRDFIPDKYNSSSNLSLNGGIFLRYSESGSYSLYLKLPRLSTDTESYKEVRLQTGLGVRRYSASELLQSKLVPVIPKLPLVEVTASGCLSSIGAEVKAYAEQFRSFGNYFKVSAEAGGGRLLAIEEPLEWGENYLLLTLLQFALVPAIFGLKIETTECWKGWTLYDIVLPSFSDTEGEFEIRILTRFLNRAIKAPYAHAYFITPPHHIEQDGTYVYPTTTERIVIRRTASGCITVKENQKAVIKNLDREWVQITDLEIGYFSILVEGREELLGKIEVCDLFQPRGVYVVIDDRTWEIFEPELHETIQYKTPENIRIECPSLRVADRLALEQNVWDREKQSFILRKKSWHPVDAGNFGILTWPPAEEGVDGKYSNIDLLTEARRIWLEGIVASFYGPNALLQLHKEWNSTSISGYPQIAIAKLAWLFPHIELARRGIR